MPATLNSPTTSYGPPPTASPRYVPSIAHLFRAPELNQEVSPPASSAPPTFREFLAHVCITDANRGVIPMELWPHLVERAEAWERGESEVVLKARQLGISWLLAAYALWVAMYRPGSTVLELSQGQAEAYELLGKSRSIHDSLPVALRVPIATDSAGELAFSGGGRVLALPATQRAGRGYTATLVIADEAAFHPWAAANYAAYKPTIDGGGQFLMVSTANGPSGFFHDLYWASERGETPYNAVFIPWWARPHRDEAWLERERQAFEGLPAEFDQEYPDTPEAAFVTQSGSIFADVTFRRVQAEMLPPMQRVVVWVDPAVTDTDRSDSQAIQVDGLGANGVIYRLWSWERRASPLEALRQAIRQAVAFKADTVGVETDQGGDTWLSVYREALAAEGIPASRARWAFRSEKAGSIGPKTHRAQQMLVDYQRGRIVHVVGPDQLLERALRRFPVTKPFDLVDAAFWAWHDLRQGWGEPRNVFGETLPAMFVDEGRPEDPREYLERRKRLREEIEA